VITEAPILPIEQTSMPAFIQGVLWVMNMIAEEAFLGIFHKNI
jgi:hypothetical protein